MNEINRLDERIEGLENLITLLDDMLFYVNLKPNDVPNNLLHYSGKLLEFFEKMLVVLKENNNPINFKKISEVLE